MNIKFAMRIHSDTVQHEKSFTCKRRRTLFRHCSEDVGSSDQAQESQEALHMPIGHKDGYEIVSDDGPACPDRGEET